MSTTQEHTDQLAAFHALWEKAQAAQGAILRAYYHGTRPEYVRAVYDAAYALADLEHATSPNHEDKP